MKPVALKILGVILFVSVCHPSITTHSTGGRMSVTFSVGQEPVREMQAKK